MGLDEITAVCDQLHGALRRAREDEPKPRGEGGSHQHRLGADRQSTIQDGRHRHLFEIDGVIVPTAEDGAHWHLAGEDAIRTNEDGRHSHLIQLPDGAALETGEDVSDHDHDMLVSRTGVDGTHIHTLKLPTVNDQLTSIQPADYARLIRDPDDQRDDAEKDSRPGTLQRPHKCKFGDEPATKALVWADGRAFIAVCDDDEALGRRIIAGNKDSVTRVVALPQATGKVADDPPAPAVGMPNALSKSQRKQIHLFKADRAGEERFVLGIVLEPEVEDSQADIYSAEEVRLASHWFMEHGRALGRQHEQMLGKGARLLENYIAPVDMMIDGQPVKKGSWIMGWRIVDDAVWADVKAGRLTGFSIGGDSIRVMEEGISN